MKVVEVNNLKLVIFIVKKGKSEKIIKNALKEGVSGFTIIYGRGTAEKDIYEKILGIEYKPEKDIVLIVTENNIVDNLLNKINEIIKLECPNQGIAFTIDLKKFIGTLYQNKLNKEVIHE